MPSAKSFQGRTVKKTGKINFDMPTRVIDHVKDYPDETRVSIEIKKFYKKRSLPQNSYLHKAFTIIGDHLGYEVGEMKYILKDMFLKAFDENDFPRVKKTSELDTVEFERFAEKVRMFAAGFGVNIMTPTEYWASKGIKKEQS